MIKNITSVSNQMLREICENAKLMMENTSIVLFADNFKRHLAWSAKGGQTSEIETNVTKNL